MKKILKITLINHLSNIKWAFFSALIYYSIVYLIFGNAFYSNSSGLFLAVHLWVIIPCLIVFYIHSNYFYMNRKTHIRIENGYIFDMVENKKINNFEIQKIIINKSYSLTIGRVAVFPYQHYKYCEVILKNGNKIILTSLLKHNIDEYLKENLKGVLFENNFFPFSFVL